MQFFSPRTLDFEEKPAKMQAFSLKFAKLLIFPEKRCIFAGIPKLLFSRGGKTAFLQFLSHFEQLNSQTCYSRPKMASQIPIDLTCKGGYMQVDVRLL
jgi:hypothetical protein